VTNHSPRPSTSTFAPTVPAELQNPHVPAAAPALKLLVKGFRKIELQLLDGTVKLSQRRTPRIDLLTDEQGRDADVVMIDVRDPQAMQWAADQPWLESMAVIWIDGANAPNGHTLAQRPVQWPILPMLLARALEHGPQRNTDAERPSRTHAPSESVRRPVLVVDDSLAVRAYLRSQLEAHGIAVDDAASAEAGIEAAETVRYACILMDVLMPGIDGYEACRRIKARQRTGSAPAIVMLTSKSSPFDRIRGKMAGCDAYLTKPVDSPQLHEVLARYVGAPARRPAAQAEPKSGAPPRLAL
jgi:two-component system, cell cycle response regulator